jgi:hypothetical protein
VPTSGEHLVFAFNANLLQNATDELKDAENALKKAEEAEIKEAAKVKLAQ